jgi:hypothetical protein
MARYVLTDPQHEALKAGWEAGSVGLSDEQWMAVQVALEMPPPAGRGAVEIDLSDDVETDLRSGFAAGLEEVWSGDQSLAAMADAMAGVAEMLGIQQGPSPGR